MIMVQGIYLLVIRNQMTAHIIVILYLVCIYKYQSNMSILIKEISRQLLIIWRTESKAIIITSLCPMKLFIFYFVRSWIYKRLVKTSFVNSWTEFLCNKVCFPSSDIVNQGWYLVCFMFAFSSESGKYTVNVNS